MLVLMDDGFYLLEKKALEESKDKKKLEEAQAMLSTKKIAPAEQLRALKIVAPLALIYLKYWEENRREDGSITTETPGVFNPRYS